ncbi:MAG: MoxR family ATPase [Gammaproteobacteria bacterium]|nr:MoxR family ATPase [Gammaproteobacteria bacterium]
MDHTIPGTSVVMKRRVPAHPDAPENRPFIFPEDQVKDLDIGLKCGMNIMLTGPTGVGKTALPRAICAELGLPLVRFNLDGETRVSNLRGMNIPAAKDGVLTLQFSLGALAKCMKDGYAVLLDEIDAALPSVRFVLQPVLEEDNRSLTIPETGETITALDNGFAVFATGNTIGFRVTQRAAYAGTNMMNAAFLDRFGMVIGVDYPTKEQEYARVLINVPGCDTDIIDGICRVAEELRSDDKFKSDFSTRRCVQWARLCEHFGTEGVLRAAKASVLRKLEMSTDARVAREIICHIFGYDESAL